MNEIYANLKEGVVKAFLKHCYNVASFGQTGTAVMLDFMHMIAIIHEQEKIFVRESDYEFVRHVIRYNRKDLQNYILAQLKENEFKNSKVKVKANRFNGYCIKIKAEW